MGTEPPNCIAEEKRERKRMQNRLNQRARRKRLRDEDGTKSRSLKSPYHVHRWRIAEHRHLSANSSGSPHCANRGYLPDDITSQLTRTHQISNQKSSASRNSPRHNLGFALPVDHSLIHLITQNAGRGIASNKTLLRFGAVFIGTANNLPLPADLLTACAISVIRPTHQAIPDCLQPTQLQMNLAHPTWIDALPFPSMRDSLIRQQLNFNHVHFLEDIVGDLVHSMPAALAKQGKLTLPGCPSKAAPQDDTEVAPNTKGLILWGEPHLEQNWEFTPRFLKKWAWAVRGCVEVVSISNRWRAARGEDPLDSALCI
ncbi:hypothetical protein BX600DRAFT_460888 [Xylariales sp. PMI_506]|nr:hypothetical protein BX600DRAFT_460888 [Xylariales sp. PMI_506]